MLTLSANNVSINDSVVVVNNYINNKNCDFNNPVTVYGKDKSYEAKDKVTDDYFVYVWTLLSEQGLERLAEELGMQPHWVYYRYLRLKDEGVPLRNPSFSGPWSRANVAKLTGIINLTEERMSA